MTVRLSSKRRAKASRPKNRHALPQAWVDSVPNRASRPRRRANGRLVPVKNTASAKNGKGPRVGIVTGVNARAVHGLLDRRYAFAKATARYTEEYRAHVGSDRTVAMDDLCISAARHKAIANLAYSKLREGPFDSEDNIRAVYEAFRRADSDHRSVLASLGIERRERQIPDLQEYLRAKGKPRLLKGPVEDAEEVS